MEVMWDYTSGFVEHLRNNPIRLGSSPSPGVGAVAGGGGGYVHPPVAHDE
jgi:hypothetical protein